MDLGTSEVTASRRGERVEVWGGGRWVGGQEHGLGPQGEGPVTLDDWVVGGYPGRTCASEEAYTGAEKTPRDEHNARVGGRLGEVESGGQSG